MEAKDKENKHQAKVIIEALKDELDKKTKLYKNKLEAKRIVHDIKVQLEKKVTKIKTVQ